jgi:hypothetical protein
MKINHGATEITENLDEKRKLCALRVSPVNDFRASGLRGTLMCAHHDA